MNEQLVKTLGDVAVVLSPLLIALLGLLAKKLADFIASKTRSEALRAVLVKLDTAVFSVVGELEQTVVEKLKKHSEDGKLTKEEIEDIKAAVLAKLKSYISFDEIGKLLGASDVEAFVASRVESAVHAMRKADPQ